MTPIEVVEMKILSGNGDRRLKAFVSVKVGDWALHDWRIIQQPGQRAWVSVPQASWRDESGQVRYRALLSLPGELKQRIDVAILSAWEEEKNKIGSQTPR